jgi:hypothetical protein
MRRCTTQSAWKESFFNVVPSWTGPNGFDERRAKGAGHLGDDSDSLLPGSARLRALSWVTDKVWREVLLERQLCIPSGFARICIALGFKVDKGL